MRVVEAINPSTLPKSRKTDAEAAHIREAMEQDGAAMCEFYAWFEAALARGERITELTIDEQLSAARAAPPGLRRPELLRPSPASTPTARCRTTAPRPNRTR